MAHAHVEPLVSFKGVQKSYDGANLVVKNLDLDIHQGEFVALIGPSGSGKSTLMNTLGCLDRPTEGSYLLADVEVAGLNPDQLAQVRNQRIGFIFQSFNLKYSSICKLSFKYTNDDKTIRQMFHF